MLFLNRFQRKCEHFDQHLEFTQKSVFVARVRVDPWAELFTHKPPSFIKIPRTRIVYFKSPTQLDIPQHPPVTRPPDKAAFRNSRPDSETPQASRTHTLIQELAITIQKLTITDS